MSGRKTAKKRFKNGVRSMIDAHPSLQLTNEPGFFEPFNSVNSNVSSRGSRQSARSGRSLTPRNYGNIGYLKYAPIQRHQAAAAFGAVEANDLAAVRLGVHVAKAGENAADAAAAAAANPNNLHLKREALRAEIKVANAKRRLEILQSNINTTTEGAKALESAARYIERQRVLAVKDEINAGPAAAGAGTAAAPAAAGPAAVAQGGRSHTSKRRRVSHRRKRHTSKRGSRRS
jgi:hypothetical protein